MNENPGLIESFLHILNNNLKHFKLFCFIVLLPTVFAFVSVMWLIKPTYSASAVVTPPASSSNLNSLNGLLGSGVSSYVSLLGLSSGADDADAIWTIFNSWELHDMVLSKFDLAKHYKFKGHFHADLLKEFRQYFSIDFTKENMIEISIEDENYELASEMVSFMLARADSMYNVFKTSQARQAREYFEKRIQLCLGTLDSLERAFVDFQVKNNFYDPSFQMESTIKYLGDLQAEQEAVSVEMNYEKLNRGVDSKRYDELRKRHSSLESSLSQTLNGKRQSLGIVALKKSPGLGAEYLRKESEIKVQEALYKLLRQQSEQLQLEEAKQLKNLHILEAPWPNDKKISPRRGVILMFTVLVFSLIATVICNMLEFMADASKRGAPVAREWASFVKFFRRKKV
ncbi:MAG: lipopolysaccharide biosynthesis protein [Fibrobacteraceae bacterium]|nr:lipopolysaccharide biosynthesis protein [Fibrobacteraceae bacterium]